VQSAGRGLAPTEGAKQTGQRGGGMIIYSAGAGQQALDRTEHRRSRSGTGSLREGFLRDQRHGLPVMRAVEKFVGSGGLAAKLGHAQVVGTTRRSVPFISRETGK